MACGIKFDEVGPDFRSDTGQLKVENLNEVRKEEIVEIEGDHNLSVI